MVKSSASGAESDRAPCRGVDLSLQMRLLVVGEGKNAKRFGISEIYPRSGCSRP